jgi:hypothetical protein
VPEAAYCPQCGGGRSGSLRYCANCGRDFEGDAPAGISPAQSVAKPVAGSPESASFFSPLNVVLILIAIGAVGAFLWVLFVTGTLGQNFLAVASVTPSATVDATPSSPPPTPSPEPTPCVDRRAFEGHRDRVTAELTAATAALEVRDFAGSLPHERIAASELRAQADLIEPVDRTVAAHFARAADATDASASAIGSNDVDGAISWITQSINELEQGINGLRSSMYCSP